MSTTIDVQPLTVEMQQVASTPAPHQRDVSQATAESTTDVDSQSSQQPRHEDICETPTELIWQNVRYSVPLGRKKGEKQILKGVSGRAHGGQVIAILGGSGAGKTTLLNSIAGRIPTGTLTGQILLNGQKRERSTWKKTVGYVEQEDLLYNDLTVFESLSYAAQLRLPNELFTREQKIKRAEEVLLELGLKDARDTKIGDPERGGISGTV